MPLHWLTWEELPIPLTSDFITPKQIGAVHSGAGQGAPHSDNLPKRVPFSEFRCIFEKKSFQLKASSVPYSHVKSVRRSLLVSKFEKISSICERVVSQFSLIPERIKVSKFSLIRFIFCSRELPPLPAVCFPLYCPPTMVGRLYRPWFGITANIKRFRKSELGEIL